MFMMNVLILLLFMGFCYVLRRLQRRENWARPLKNAMIANFWHGHELAEALPMTHAVAVVITIKIEGSARADPPDDN